MIKHDEKGRKKGSKEKLLVMLKNSIISQPNDGLSNIDYKVSVVKKTLYTHLRVKLTEVFTNARDDKNYKIIDKTISLV